MNDSRSGFGSLHMPRSRGAVSGLLLIILGVWGALVPFVGPYFHFAYTPGEVWVWSTARAWLEVFPGATTAVGGFLLLVSGNRATAMFGGWLAVIAGAGSSSAARWRRRCGSATSATRSPRRTPSARRSRSRPSPGWARSSSSSAERCWRGCRPGWRATWNSPPMPSRCLPPIRMTPSAESTATTVLDSVGAAKHRRESEGGLFRRAPQPLTTWSLT